MSEVVVASKPFANMSAQERAEYVQELERKAEAAEARAIAAEEDARIAKAANTPVAKVPHVWGLTYVTRGALAGDGKLWPLTSDGFEFHVGLDADGGKRVRLSESHAKAICAELPALLDAFYAPPAEA